MGSSLSRRARRFCTRADESLEIAITTREFYDRIRPGRQRLHAAAGMGNDPCFLGNFREKVAGRPKLKLRLNARLCLLAVLLWIYQGAKHAAAPDDVLP